MSSKKKTPGVVVHPPNDTNSAAAAVSLRTFRLPFALTLILFLLSFVPRIADNAVLSWSFRCTALVLLAWQIVLLLRLKNAQSLGGKVTPTLNVVLRPQHYVQAAVQFSVYVYWGYYWPPVYAHVWHIVAQLVFAYAFDILLTWSRRENYTLGFGAFPIVFSANLFLWFRDDWFYLQFLMIAVGFMGKEFIRWRRDDRNSSVKSTHIFNPSAFTLAVFALILVATNTTDLTWGQQIASTLTLAPHVYLFLFAIGLIVMYCFAITPVTAAAAAVLFALSALYAAMTGTPYFIDSEIPAAVFLGLHLLVTDPSTSPRTALGKAIFGALYGMGVFALYALLGAIGAPTFYDKLLCVPLLNLAVQRIDRLADSIQSISVWARFDWRRASANLNQMAVWIVFFVAMSVAGKTDGMHTGDSIPFWERACKESRLNACERLVSLEVTYCGDNSAWACNELGIHYLREKSATVDTERGLQFFSKACELRFQASCVNLLHPATLLHANPHVLDLRLLLRERGSNLMSMSEQDLYARACDHGWAFACNDHVSSP